MSSFYDSDYRTESITYAHSTYVSLIKPHTAESLDQLMEASIGFINITKAVVEEEFNNHFKKCGV